MISLFECQVFMKPTYTAIFRQAYDINDLLGDLGGVVRVLMSIFGVIFYPISQFLFFLNSVKQMYLARTKEADLLENASCQNSRTNHEKKMMNYTNGSKIPAKYSKSMTHELSKHRVINLSLKDLILLFIFDSFNCFMCK